MGEGRNLSPEQIMQMMQMMKSGEKSGSSEQLKGFAEKNMSNEQVDQLKKVLGDKDALNNLLASEAAKKLMEKFSGGNQQQGKR